MQELGIAAITERSVFSCAMSLLAVLRSAHVASGDFDGAKYLLELILNLPLSPLFPRKQHSLSMVSS